MDVARAKPKPGIVGGPTLRKATGTHPSSQRRPPTSGGRLEVRLFPADPSIRLLHSALRCDDDAIYRKKTRLQLFTVVALLILALLTTEVPAHQAAPEIGGGMTHFFQTRVLHDTKSIATYHGCRLLTHCGDPEANPSPTMHASDCITKYTASLWWSTAAKGAVTITTYTSCNSEIVSKFFFEICERVIGRLVISM